MNSQPFGIFFGRAQLKFLSGGFNGELPFQQFDEQGGDPGRRILVGMQSGGGLQFLTIVNEFQHVVAQQIVLVLIIRGDFFFHFHECRRYFICLLISDLKNRIAARFKNREFV